MKTKEKLVSTAALSIGLLGCNPIQGTVHWEVKSTGCRGHGQPIDYQLAQAWAEIGNRDHPELRHWVE